MKKIFSHAFAGYVFPDGEYTICIESCSQEEIFSGVYALFLLLRVEGVSYDGKTEVAHMYEEVLVNDLENRRYCEFCNFLETNGIFVADCRNLKGAVFKVGFSKEFVGYTALPVVKYLSVISPPPKRIPLDKVDAIDQRPHFPHEIRCAAGLDFGYHIFPAGEYIVRIAQSWIEELSEGVNGIFFKAFCYEKNKNFDEGIHSCCFIIIDRPDIPQRNDFFNFLGNQGIDFFEYDTLFGMEFEAELQRKDFGGIILPAIKFGRLLALPFH